MAAAVLLSRVRSECKAVECMAAEVLYSFRGRGVEYDTQWRADLSDSM